MNLPDLPRTHKKPEADFGVKLRHIINTLHLEQSSLELKHTRGSNSFPFAELGADQIAWGLKCKDGAMIRVQGTSGEPDYVWMKGATPYIIIRYPKGEVVIKLETFLNEKAISKRKSLTWERAISISEINVI
jgi:hypothetical protein